MSRSTMMTSDPGSPVELLMQACVSTGGILANVTRNQLDLPTPCAGWQVRDLIDHIVGAAGFFADLAQYGASAEDAEQPGRPGGDYIAAFGQQSGRAIEWFSAAGAMERTMALPTGPAPGARCIEVATGEILVHGWDLARSTGQPRPAGTGVAEALLASPWLSLCAQVRDADPAVFGPAIDVPADAPAADRLAAFLGRDPDPR